ncbi:MAG TPA: hypothetical protein PLA83_03230 [Deltaproteobacteria bacterium]|nr:hypothetical protein [Deltaproteobacteria bacterium]HQI00894.1 hypothetical protein [Deltaproteobacteria bacterium]HQJ07919.1 hypothetical protein [Deltaproteobacteria bacterium]
MRLDEVLRTCGQTGMLTREEILFLLSRSGNDELYSILSCADEESFVSLFGIINPD